MVFTTFATTLFTHVSFVFSYNHCILLLVYLFPVRIKNKLVGLHDALLFQWLVNYTIQEYLDYVVMGL